MPGQEQKKLTKRIPIAEVALLGGLVAALVGLPVKINEVDYRGLAKTIHLTLPKLTPPFAALEDTRATDEDEFFELELDDSSMLDTKKETLVAGEGFNPIKMQGEQIRIIAKNDLKLKGLVIKQQAQKLVKVNSEKSSSVVKLSNPNLTVEQSSLFNKSEPINIAQNSVKTPSLEERAKPLIEDALLEMQASEAKREIPTASGSVITVKKPKTKQAAKPESPVIARPTTPTKESQPSVEDLRNFPYVVSGNLEMKGGVAYMGVGSQLNVVQVHSGFVQNRGVVWPTEARFEIAIDKLEGYLIAELRDTTGKLIGYGEIDLLKVRPQKNERKINSILLQIEPAPEGLMVEVNSARSMGGEKIVVENAQVSIDSLDRAISSDKSGKYIDRTISSDSSYIVRAEKEGYWGSVAVKPAREQPSKVELFPNSMIEALISLNVRESNLAKLNSYGVVWGRVMDNGRPIKNARVEMTGEGYVGPIYFSSFIPDKSLQKTSKNGLFAFVKVKPGIHSVRIVSNHGDFPVEIFPVEAKSVSSITLSKVKPYKAEVSLFDALETQKQLPGTLHIVGSQREMQIPQKVKRVQFPGGKGLMVLEADAGEPYEVSRVTSNRKVKRVEFPMINKGWLAKIAERAGVYPNPDKGVLVGFNTSGWKDLFVNGESGFSSAKIVYLDKQGNPSTAARTLDQDGVFVVFNIDPGYRTITLQDSQSMLTETQVFIAAPAVLNVIRSGALN